MTNHELRALCDWVQAHPNQRGRITRGPYTWTGDLGTQTATHPEGDRVRVHVRDSKRVRHVFSLDDLEIKVNGRYTPAREIVPVPETRPHRWVPPDDKRVPINIHPDAREALRSFLCVQRSADDPYFACGYSEFIMHAVERAKQEVADAPTA